MRYYLLGITLISAFTIAKEDPFLACTYHECIHKLMRKYERPITILEISTHRSCLSFELTQRYQATAVVINVNHKEELLRSCIEHRYNSVVLLDDSITLKELQHLSECEHFDVVLITGNVIEHFNDPDSTLKALLNMGDFILCESLPSSCWGLKAVKKYGYYMGSFYVFNMHKKYLQRSAWPKDYDYAGAFRIRSTFKKKKLHKRWNPRGTAWIPGINLLTAKMLHVQFPSYAVIRAAIQRFEQTRHNDLWIGNMVIQGTAVRLIDFGDKRRRANPKEKFPLCLAEFKD